LEITETYVLDKNLGVKVEDIKTLTLRIVNIFNFQETEFLPTRISTRIRLKKEQAQILEKINLFLSQLEAEVEEIEENFDELGFQWKFVCFLSYYVQQIRGLQIDFLEKTFSKTYELK
jgi:hypothetical protein